MWILKSAALIRRNTVVNYKKTIFDKNIEKCDVSLLRKTSKYLHIQESLRYENSTEYYLCKGIFLYVFSTLKDIIQAQSIINPWIS